MYLIRLDDASDYMHIENWECIERMLDKYNIRPLVGIIPVNKDPMLTRFVQDPEFWLKANNWQNKGWRIALHGYEHVYSTICGGNNPVQRRSEFAGHPLEVQQVKIKEGMKVLKEKGLHPTVFFAPSHTFDEITLRALQLESEIRIISDTIANDIYCKSGFTFIPQQSGKVRELPFKCTTICLHPNYLSDHELSEIEDFLRSHENQFIDPNNIKFTTRKRNLWDYGLQIAYFIKRKLRK